jgi:hypothetical protein
MMKKSRDEFFSIECYVSFFTIIFIIFVSESDVSVFDALDTVVIDGYPVGISANVFDYLSGAVKRRFAIRYPITVNQGKGGRP